MNEDEPKFSKATYDSQDDSQDNLTPEVAKAWLYCSSATFLRNMQETFRYLSARVYAEDVNESEDGAPAHGWAPYVELETHARLITLPIGNEIYETESQAEDAAKAWLEPMLWRKIDD